MGQRLRVDFRSVKYIYFLAKSDLDIFTDGGGVRVISSVLILKEIFLAVMVQELAIDSKATSSYSPLANPDDSKQPMEEDLSKYLPCHYFDYIAGTSSGGYLINTHLLHLEQH